MFVVDRAKQKIFKALLTFLLCMTTILPVSASEKEIDTKPVPDSVFGVQMYGTTQKGSTYYKALIESGAKWIRTPFRWATVEPLNVAPALYHWGSVDDVTGAAATADIEIVLTVEFAPAWAAVNPDGPINKANLPDFVELMTAVVERYDGDGIDDAPGSPIVRYFEFYNEPDGYCYGNLRWGNAPKEYAEMLAAVYGPIKKANPEAKIVFGGIAFDWFQQVDSNGLCKPLQGWVFSVGGSFVFEFLENVLANGGGAYFDVMNIHTYPAFAKNWTMNFPNTNQLSIGIFEKSLYVRSLLAKYGHGDKDLIITEASADGVLHNGLTASDPVNKLQAEHVAAMYAQVKAANVKALMWWAIQDVDPNLTGLLTLAGDKKLAFDAYVTAIKYLESAKLDAILTFKTEYPFRVQPGWLGYNDLSEYHFVESKTDPASTLEAYRFYDTAKNRYVYVTWLNPLAWLNPDGKPEPKPMTLHVPAKKATILDMYGNQKSVQKDDDDGKADNQVDVPVSGEPIYILVAEADNTPSPRLHMPWVLRN